MNTEWPHLIVDLKAKRDALDQLITIIETQFAIPDDGAQSAPIEKQARRGRKPGRPKKALKRTNERTKQGASHAGAAEPP